MKSSYAIALSLSLVGCGQSSHRSLPTFDNKGNAAPAEQFTIPIKLNASDIALSTAASGFSMDLAGCASGATGTTTEASPTFSVYKTDTNCLAKLTSLAVNGISYANNNPQAIPFTSFTLNDNAVFTDSTGINKINVVVSSQLSSPVQASDAISYSFTIIQAGDAKPVSNEVLGESHSISVAGDLVPNYKIDKISFQGLNANGGGRFIIQTECLVAIKLGANPSCANLLFTDTSYVLVKDTYNGAPTAAQLAAMFPGTSVLANQVVTGTVNSLGGFATVVLDGPNQLALNPKMIFVLKNGNSFQYFLITTQSL